MITINTNVYINGVNFSMYAVRPLKWGNFLDERLDELYLSLVGTKKKAFKPMDKVEIVSTLFNKYRNTTTTNRGYYLVANDKATETPVGSGRYTHELYCIELTKMLEMYVVDSLTFTNVLGRDYTREKQPASVRKIIAEKYYPTLTLPDGGQLKTEDFPQNIFNTSSYQTPTTATLTVLPFADVFSPPASWVHAVFYGFSITVKDVNGNIVYEHEDPIANYGPNPSTAGGTTLSGLNGVYTIEYQVVFVNTVMFSTAGVYTIAAIPNNNPLKRLTCADAINRICDLATPLYEGESPKFSLLPADVDWLDKIYLPEITTTQSTLRECLQTVGKIVHAEPRLIPNGFNTYYITFDRYGGMTQGITPKRYVEKVSEQAIESYCSSVDSAAQNLVNSLNYAQGVIVEPRANAYKTVRTETQYVRISDTNMSIQLSRPIYKIIKLECGLVMNNTVSAPVDLTPYVFEQTLYNSQLSSYSDVYPYSKAYALYYSIGGKSIEGLNFKLDDAWLAPFENYAIVNILNETTGQTLKLPAAGSDDAPNFYPTLAFRVTYVPYFNVRLTQSKQYIKEFDEPAVLVYNQSANVIESRAYGENLKGVAARLGTPERSVTYWISSFYQIPTAGQLYDNDYYISTVAVEMYNNAMKCTLGLSKDFNRLSAYIGVSSERRLYEVSERAAYDRTTLYKEYIVVGDAETTDNTLLGDNFFDALVNEFTQTAEISAVDKVIAWGGTYQNPTGTTAKRPLPAVELPVVASALGNAIVFIWSYQDNYSAGAAASYQTATVGTKTYSGYFQGDYAYTDYYGKMYYYNFDLSPSTGSETTDFDTQTALGLDFPGIDNSGTPGTSSGYFSTLEYKPYIYRKDSREISQFCAEVEFVTNRKDLIIGSALAARNGLVGAQNAYPVRLYFLPFKINKFAGKITEDLSDVPYIEPKHAANVEFGEYKLTSKVPSADTIVYKDYYTVQTHIILRNPAPYSDINYNDVYYVQHSDYSTDSTVVTSAYECVAAGSSGALRRTMTIVPVEGEGGYSVMQNGKQVIITVLGDIPACEAWAFITPQYTTTQTVEDDEGNVSEQTYYEGGEVLLACNTPVADGGTIAPIYFTAVHDPFAQFDSTTQTIVVPSNIPLAYAYARYDSLINKFIVYDKTVNVISLSSPVGTVFYSVDNNQMATDIGTTLYENKIVSNRGGIVTAIQRIITKK